MPRKPSNCIDCAKVISGKAKRCRKCFSITRKNNPNISVKEYRRNWQLKKKYGLEYGEFDAWWIVCRGKCFICERDMSKPTNGRGQSLLTVAVDHNHKTGKIRGLLCNRCNKGIGFFNDNISLIKKAIKYLETTDGT